jgi:Ubiquitin family
MIITIQKLDGETFIVECEPMDYVDDLRDIVEELHGVRPESQRYSCDGVPIDDTGTLKDNGIVSDCTLVMDPYTITVILPSKKKLRLVSSQVHEHLYGHVTSKTLTTYSPASSDPETR